MKLTKLAFGFACALTVATPSYSIPVFDAANFAENAASAAHLLHQIQDHARYMTEFNKHLIEQVKIKDFAELNSRRSFASVLSQYTQHWNTLQAQLQQLRGIVKNSPFGQTVTIQIIAQRYSQMYPDARSNMPQLSYNYSAAQLNSLLNYQAEQRTTRQVEMQQDLLLHAQTSLQNVQQTQYELQTANTASYSAVGTLQGIQAGNQINTRVAAELMQLNTMLALQAQAAVEREAQQIASVRAGRAQSEMDRRVRGTNTRPGSVGNAFWRQ